MSQLRVFLWLGLMGGIGLTAWGLFQGQVVAPVIDAVAIVNGRPAPRAIFETLVRAVREEQPERELSRADLERIRERMIEEELLVEEAQALGLASRDRLARGYLVQAMLDFIGNQAMSEEPTEGQLRAFFDQHRDEFVRPGRIALRVMTFAVTTGTDESATMRRALAARRRLDAGESWQLVDKQEGSEPVALLPTGPLSAVKVLEYLGPTAAREAFRLRPGEVSQPIRVAGAILLIQVLQRWEGDTPAWDEIKGEVAQRWRRARVEEAVRRYVEDLKAAAQIERLPLP